MIDAIRNKKSLTFYQLPSGMARNNVSASYSSGISASLISSVSYNASNVNTGYYSQLNSYLSFNQQTQQALSERTRVFMENVYTKTPNPTATALRDKATWSLVKRFVTREELMKLQIGGSADLPLSKSQLENLKVYLADKDLTSISDKEIEKIIDLILSILVDTFNSRNSKPKQPLSEHHNNSFVSQQVAIHRLQSRSSGCSSSS